jgi:hypothetical protein
MTFAFEIELSNELKLYLEAPPGVCAKGGRKGDSIYDVPPVVSEAVVAVEVKDEA